MVECDGRDRNAGPSTAGSLDAESQTSIDGELPVRHAMQSAVRLQDVQGNVRASPGVSSASIVLDMLCWVNHVIRADLTRSDGVGEPLVFRAPLQCELSEHQILERH